MRPGHRHRLPLTPRLAAFLRAGWALLCLPLALAGCAGTAPEPVAGASAASFSSGRVFLLTHGWHTDIAVPAGEVTGPLARFRDMFPGARTLVFGYGKRTFMIAPAHTLGEWIIGPFPGPAAIEISAISADPATAYGASHVETLPLPPGGAARLSTFLWRSLAKDADGGPSFIAQGNWPGSLFYAARRDYALWHTCNRWSAEALAAAGLPVTPGGVIFSGTLDGEVRRLAPPPAAG